MPNVPMLFIASPTTIYKDNLKITSFYNFKMKEKHIDNSCMNSEILFKTHEKM